MISFTQVWEQTANSPEGAGITEIAINPENNHIFVTTASFDWPLGDKGGIRRSTDGGDSWENLMDVYNGRTITYGADGNLYASAWPHPAHEGLYRSTDNGDNWEQITVVAFGNNFFSITVSTLTNPHTIFAGTRMGVWRSTDNGTTWGYANEGIPWATWVRDIEVDSSGIIVAATTAGILISDDNGDNWQQATGAGSENDTITKIIFDYPFEGKGNTRLIAGSNKGNIYKSFEDATYLQATLLTVFAPHEISGITLTYLESEQKKMHAVATYPMGTLDGGFKYSWDLGTTWQSNNAGLGGDTPNMSAMVARSTPIKIKLTAGMFNNTNGGALVMKAEYDWSQLTDVANNNLISANEGILCQNFPNPFSHNTSISFYLEEAAQVKLKVYASDGHLVSTLLESKQSVGEHQLTINAGDLEEGIYFYQLDVEGLTEVRKMVVLK